MITRRTDFHFLPAAEEPLIDKAVSLKQGSCYHNYIKYFLSFVAVILNLCPNIPLVRKYFCRKVCPNLNLMATVCKLRRTVGKIDFSGQFKKIATHYKKDRSYEYSAATACMVVNPIMFDSCASLFN